MKIKYIQVLLDGAYSPTDFKCEITLFWGIKKDRATGSPLLGLMICYEIAQKGAKMLLKMQKMMVYKKRLIDHLTWLSHTK